MTSTGTHHRFLRLRANAAAGRRCREPRTVVSRFAARAPLLNRCSASRICCPYASVLRSPNPEMRRIPASESGRRRQTSSSVLSYITMKAGTPCCVAAFRRHSRRYSRSAGSTSASHSPAGVGFTLTGRSAVRCESPAFLDNLDNDDDGVADAACTTSAPATSPPATLSPETGR